MTWTAPRTWVTTELVTSSQLNTHVRDNLLETAPAKVTTKGDSVWSTGANAIVRLSVGSNGQMLIADSGSTPGVKWTADVVASESGGSITFGTGSGGHKAVIDGGATGERNLEFHSGGSLRWKIMADDSSESGSNAGTNLHMEAYDDVGVRLRGGPTFFINRANGFVGINESLNANMTAGLVVNQLLADDEIFAAKSSDVAHGITDAAETDTYFTIVKKDSSNGGVRLDGYNEGTIGMFLVGNATTEETSAPSNASIANVMVVGQKKSGTSVGLQGANAHLFAIRNFGTTRWLVDAEGDTYRDGTDNTFDEWDDIQLARAFELEMSPAKVIRSQFDEFLRYGRDDLVRAGILTGAGDFYNESQLLRLVTGGLWQISNRINETTEALQGRLNQALARIEMLEQRLITND